MADATDASRPNDRSDRQRALGQAIRRFREAQGLTQEQLGELLDPHLGYSVPQTTVSRWEIGSVSMDYETVWAIEIALRLPLGTIGAATGYVQPGVEPPVQVIKSMWLSDRRDALRAVRDADNLGFGVRLHTLLWPDRDIEGQSTEFWVLDLTADIPERES